MEHDLCDHAAKVKVKINSNRFGQIRSGKFIIIARQVWRQSGSVRNLIVIVSVLAQHEEVTLIQIYLFHVLGVFATLIHFKLIVIKLLAYAVELREA